MNSDLVIIATIVGPILGAGIGVWLKSVWEKKPKVICYSSHISDFKINNESYLITNASMNLFKQNDIPNEVLEKLKELQVGPPLIKSAFTKSLEEAIGELLDNIKKEYIIKNSLLTPNFNLFTHSVVIRNSGKKVANNIKIGHSNNIKIGHYFLPINFKIYPAVDYQLKELPEGNTGYNCKQINS